MGELVGVGVVVCRLGVLVNWWVAIGWFRFYLNLMYLPIIPCSILYSCSKHYFFLECFNDYGDEICDTYIKNYEGYCNYSGAFMKLHCAKSCNFCKGNQRIKSNFAL